MQKKIDWVSVASVVGMALTLIAKLVTDYADDGKLEKLVDEKVDKKFAEHQESEES